MTEDYNRDKNDYYQFYWENILKFTANRFFPYVSMSIVGLLIAHKNFEEFSFYSYVSLAYIFPATIATFMFLTIGNIQSDTTERLNQQDIFSSSFVVAVTSALFVLGACFVIFMSSESVINLYEESYRAETLSIYYMAYTFIYVINSFFNCFYEAHIKDTTSSKARVISSIPLISFSIVAFALFDQTNFSVTLVQALLACALLECVYYVYVTAHKKLFTLTFNFSIAKKIITLGVPSSLGLASQRFAFFIVNKHLLPINKDFISLFSIAISITSLLLIPVSAFSQIHSIYVSNNPAIKVYRKSFMYLTLSLLPALLAFTVFSRELFFFFGTSENLINENPLLPACVGAILITTALLMLLTAQLRARGTTLLPQIFINLALYLIYVSATFLGVLEGRPVSSILFLYAASYFICYIFLNAYLIKIDRSILA